VNRNGWRHALVVEDDRVLQHGLDWIYSCGGAVVGFLSRTGIFDVRVSGDLALGEECGATLSSKLCDVQLDD